MTIETGTTLSKNIERSHNGDSDAGTLDGGDGIFTVRGSGIHRGWNGIRYKTGLSAKNVPAKALSMNVARIPPGGVAFAHIHVEFEVMLYILEGSVRHEYGPNLRHSIDNQAGDFIFIEPGVPHEVFNASQTEEVVAIVARSDASEWENIVDYDRETGKVIPKRGASAEE
ncbi:MAG: cupin domain-containing protein [Longimicrobiales bacterium]